MISPVRILEPLLYLSSTYCTGSLKGQEGRYKPENARLMAEHALCCTGNHSKGYPYPHVCSAGNIKKIRF
jgi:hypothetical protein